MTCNLATWTIRYTASDGSTWLEGSYAGTKAGREMTDLNARLVTEGRPYVTGEDAGP